MPFDRGPLADLTERQLLIRILEQQEHIMAEISDIKQTEAADKDALAAIVADLDGIKQAVADTAKAQQAKVDGLQASNSDLQDKVAKLQAGDALTQAQIDDLAVASKDNGAAIQAVKASADALLASVQPPAQPDASGALGSQIVGRS